MVAMLCWYSLHACTNDSIKRCINCNGEHWASSWECPRYKKEELVEAIRERQRITYREAAVKASKQTESAPQSSVFPIPSTPYSSVVAGERSGEGSASYGQHSDRGVENSKMTELTQIVRQLQKQVELQNQIILIQTKILNKITAKSMYLSGDPDIRDYMEDLKSAYRVSDNINETESDEDEDDSMDVFDGRVSDKRKYRSSVASHEDLQSNLSGKHNKKRRQQIHKAAVKAAAKAASALGNETDTGQSYYTADYTKSMQGRSSKDQG